MVKSHSSTHEHDGSSSDSCCGVVLWNIYRHGQRDGIAAPISAACKAIYTSVIKADRLYISLQFDVVSAAKAYVASNSLTNRLVYNNSYIKAIQAGNAELNIAIKSPGCYSAKNISSYKANVKTNLSEIATIFAANVNGQIVGDPKKMATFKPVGLLK